MHISTHKPVNRRTFLRGAGALMALPMLEAMMPSVLKAAAPAGQPIKRFVAITNPFGFYGPAFFPKEAGRNYGMTELLKPLEPYRNDFTVFSHLDHDVSGGHSAVHTLLSGVKNTEGKGYADGCISMDQLMAEHYGPATRFPDLAIGSHTASWSRNAVMQRTQGQITKLYEQLFVDPSSSERAKMHKNLALNGSVLDAVNDQAKVFARRLGTRDKEKLDQYFTGVRELERKMGMSEEWIDKPKPKVKYKKPARTNGWDDYESYMDIIALALETDSTRVITFGAHWAGMTSFFGLQYDDYHKYSHHGKHPDLYNGLVTIEKYQTQQTARLLDKLKQSDDMLNGGKMLDHTMLMLASGMADPSAHTNRDLPILLAGGGFKHGEHKVYPSEKGKKVPLCNLYVTMMQKMGMQRDKFAKSTGTLRDFS